jgi:RNA polymerase sigma-32 factor
MGTSLTSAVGNVVPGRNLSWYLQKIHTFPLLSPEEELLLSKRWRDCNDVEAANRLVTSHLRLVAKIAVRYRGYGLPVGDLISEGTVGMMQAVKRFDPDRGFRLATYAMWWIRAAIQEYILHAWSPVKVGTTAIQKKLFFNLRRLKARMQAVEEGDLSPEHLAQIAKIMDVPEQEVVAMNRRLLPCYSLNAPISPGREGEWQDWLVSNSESQETVIAECEEFAVRSALLATAMKVLSGRERHILIEHRLQTNPTTLEDLAQQYNVSRERVRQIEVKAIRKLQEVMKGDAVMPTVHQNDRLVLAQDRALQDNLLHLPVASSNRLKRTRHSTSAKFRVAIARAAAPEARAEAN